MAVSEIEDRLYYKRMQDEHKQTQIRLNMLDNAYYTGCLVMNEKIDKAYKAIQKDILGQDGATIDKNKFKRFKMISKRLGLEYPGERVD
jgi:hypothetical protein